MITPPGNSVFMALINIYPRFSGLKKLGRNAGEGKLNKTMAGFLPSRGKKGGLGQWGGVTLVIKDRGQFRL